MSCELGRTEQPFTYYGTPNVTALSPASGPTLSNTPALVLADTGRRVWRAAWSSHYRCRFGGGGAFEYIYAMVQQHR